MEWLGGSSKDLGTGEMGHVGGKGGRGIQCSSRYILEIKDF